MVTLPAVGADAHDRLGSRTTVSARVSARPLIEMTCDGSRALTTTSGRMAAGELGTVVGVSIDHCSSLTVTRPISLSLCLALLRASLPSSAVCSSLRQHCEWPLTNVASSRRSCPRMTNEQTVVGRKPKKSTTHRLAEGCWWPLHTSHCHQTGCCVVGDHDAPCQSSVPGVPMPTEDSRSLTKQRRCRRQARWREPGVRFDERRPVR